MAKARNIFPNVVRASIGFGFFLALFAHAQDLTSWMWRYPYPQANTLHDVTSAKDRFVAVGENGTIITSGDGVSWTNRTSNTATRLMAVGYGPERFLAVGDRGTILTYGNIVTSPLGATWTTRYTTNPSFVAVASCPDVQSPIQAVAMGYSSYCTSPDGVTWNGPFPGVDGGIWAMGYGNGLFVATGNGGQIATMDVRAATGPSGTWTLQSSPVPYLMHSVCYGNGLYFIAGQRYVMSSTNGTNWSIAYTAQSSSLLSIVYGGGKYVGVGLNHVVVSQDGQTWVETNIAGASFNAVTYGSGKFVTVGENGQIQQSTDGLNWSQVSSAVVPMWTSATYGANKLVAAGGGWSINVAVDGATTLGQLTVSNVSKTIYAAGRFVCVGGNGGIATSLDGVSWNTVSTHVTNWFNDVLYTNNLLVAVGDSGLIMTSPDGLAWHSQPAGTANRLQTLFFSQGAFNAVGINGTLLRSTNGTNWVSSPFGGTGYSVYGNGTWVELKYAYVTYGSSNTTLLSSTDGQQWVSRGTVGYHSPATSPLFFANGYFVAFGRAGYAISTNGIDWLSGSFGIGNAIVAVSPSAQKWAAVGVGGTVLESGHLPGLQPAQLTQMRFAGANALELTMTGERDERYRVQRSSNLQSWNDLNVNSPGVIGEGSDPVVISDTNAVLSNGFYRLMLYP